MCDIIDICHLGTYIDYTINNLADEVIYYHLAYD